MFLVSSKCVLKHNRQKAVNVCRIQRDRLHRESQLSKQTQSNNNSWVVFLLSTYGRVWVHFCSDRRLLLMGTSHRSVPSSSSSCLSGLPVNDNGQVIPCQYISQISVLYCHKNFSGRQIWVTVMIHEQRMESIVKVNMNEPKPFQRKISQLK